MKRHVRFEKADFSFTCSGFCASHSPVKVVRAPLYTWFLGFFKEQKTSIRNSKIVSRRWDRVRGDIEGNDTPLSPCSIPVKAAA
jgi:hypothetical protein